jgi:hypothetical protein
MHKLEFRLSIIQAIMANNSRCLLHQTLFFSGPCALIKSMNDLSDHKNRSRQVADLIRRFVIGINTGG